MTHPPPVGDRTDPAPGDPTDPAPGDRTDPAPGDRPRPRRPPLYPRLLRLRHIRPNAWQRALLGEGAIALAVVLVLADVASAWTLLALPLGVALVVKAHDVLAGLLAAPAAHDDGAAVDTAAPSDEREG